MFATCGFISMFFPAFSFVYRKREASKKKAGYRRLVRVQGFDCWADGQEFKDSG